MDRKESKEIRGEEGVKLVIKREEREIGGGKKMG